ncbi:T9SS type A sorting domain-containing protein [bacterium]|nr:T9SS type A sorting domain-containing protein [bacterium]
MFKKTLFSVMISMFFYLNLNAQIFEYEYPELEQYLWSPRYMVKTESGVAFATMGKDQKVWMVKLDNDFQVKWSHQVFAGTGQTGPTALVWSESENCFYLGATGLWDNKWRGSLIKLDSIGSVLRETFLLQEMDESFIKDFVISGDSIFAIGSCHKEFKPQAWIACFNKQFQLIWKRKFPDNPKEGLSEKIFDRIVKTENQLIIFGAENINGGQSKIWKFSKTDGSVVWENLLNYYVGAYDLISITDGFLITGLNDESKAFVKKFDNSGNLIWEKEFDFRPGFTSRGNAVFELNDGSDDLILIGNSGEGTAIYKTHVLRLNGDGVPQREKLFLGGTSAGLYDSQTGNLILGGATQEGILRIVILYQDITSVQDEKIQPEKFLLKQNYPNPFNATTTIEYALPMKSSVGLVIYNMMGQVVSELVVDVQEPGLYHTTWNARDLSSGVYFVRISAKSVDGKENFNCIKKMTLMK